MALEKVQPPAEGSKHGRPPGHEQGLDGETWLSGRRSQSLGSLWKSPPPLPDRTRCLSPTRRVTPRLLWRHSGEGACQWTSLQDLTPSAEQQQGPWHENTPVPSLHSPGAEKPSWHELEAQPFPTSSIFQSGESGALWSSCYDDLSRSR